MRTKVLGIQKLTYLYMLGYDISWASFNVIEGTWHAGTSAASNPVLTKPSTSARGVHDL